jgi:conjugal transfer ATP-binding protein TraC
MDFLKRQQRSFNRNQLDELCPVKSFDPEAKLLWGIADEKSSFLSFAFICTPIPGVAQGTDSALKSLYSSDFGNDTMAEVLEVSTTNTTARIMSYARARSHVMYDESNPARAEFARKLVQQRTELFLKGQTTPLDPASECLLKDTYLVVSFRIPTSKEPSDDDLKLVRSLQIAAQSQFATIGFNPTPMDHELYLSVVRSLIYFDEQRPLAMDLNKEINEQIFDNDTDLQVEAEHVRINDNFFRVMSVQHYPKDMVLPKMSGLLGCHEGTKNQITCDFLIKTVIYYPERFKETQKIKKESNAIRVQAMGKFGTLIRRIGMKDENYQLLTHSIEEGHRPVKVWTSALLMCKDMDTLDKQTAQLKSYWATQGFLVNTDKLIQGPMFQQVLPLCVTPSIVDFTCRYSSMTINEAVHLLPVLADWSGPGPDANNLFISRRGSITPFCVFSSDTSNNMIIAGESGGGKSFLLADIIAGAYSRGYQIRIIDSGRSYKNLVESIDNSEFIEFSEDTNISINPFTNIRSIEQEIGPLMQILAQLCAPQEGLSDYQLSKLQSITLDVFNDYGNDMDITLLSERCIQYGVKHQDEPVRKMGEQFFPYTRHGPMGKWLNPPATLSFSGDISCLELDDLAAMPELRTVVLMMSVMTLQREFVNGDRSIRKIFLVDEAWKLILGTDKGSVRVRDFLLEFFRTARKLACSGIIGTQSLTDLAPDGHSPLIDNAATVVLMKQKKETLEAIKSFKLLNISDYDFNLLKTVQRGNGYSDAFIYTSTRGYGFCRFIVERFSQILYSTNPKETTRLKALRQSGMSVVQAIQTMMDEENKEKDEKKRA